MVISKKVLDELLGVRDPNEVFSKDGLLDDLKKALAERTIISGQMTGITCVRPAVA